MLGVYVFRLLVKSFDDNSDSGYVFSPAMRLYGFFLKNRKNRKMINFGNLHFFIQWKLKVNEVLVQLKRPYEWFYGIWDTC